MSPNTFLDPSHLRALSQSSQRIDTCILVCISSVLDDKSGLNGLSSVKNPGKLDTFSLDCLGPLFLFLSSFIHLSECHLMDPCSVLEPLPFCVWRWYAVLNGTSVSPLLGNLQASRGDH